MGYPESLSSLNNQAFSLAQDHGQDQFVFPPLASDLDDDVKQTLKGWDHLPPAVRAAVVGMVKAFKD